jgi:hypothetical protein
MRNMFQVMLDCLLIAALLLCIVEAKIAPTTEVDQAKTVEGKIRTIYDINGRPINQGQDRKGWHKIAGSTKLSSGKATLTLNTSTAQGRQDVSFLSSATFRGTAWSMDTTNTNRYWIVPLSGKTFMVKSSDGADTATVQWKVEGE